MRHFPTGVIGLAAFVWVVVLLVAFLPPALAQRNQAALTLLASAARTSTTATTAETANQYTGVLLILDVSAASGTGGLTVTVRGYDPISDNTFNLLVDTLAITATGTYGFVVAIGASAPADGIRGSASYTLPPKWDVSIAHGDGSSYTYSLAAVVIGG